MAALKKIVRALLPESAYRTIRKRRVAKLVRNFVSYPVTERYGRHMLTLSIEDPLGEGWYGKGWPELPEVRLLTDQGALKPDGVVFDLGAHQSVVALILAREVGPLGKVVAVEAEPHNVRVSERNRDLNHARNLEVLHRAVSDGPGPVAFTESLNGHIAHDGISAGAITVDAVSVDMLAEVHGVPDVVVMDIEGFEGRALNGAVRTIEAGAAFIVEVHTASLVGMTPGEIVGLFERRRRWIADGDDVGHGNEFRPFSGKIPEHRFFLAAV
jgi:FkbM family methyltransferase